MARGKVQARSSKEEIIGGLVIGCVLGVVAFVVSFLALFFVKAWFVNRRAAAAHHDSGPRARRRRRQPQPRQPNDQHGRPRMAEV
ncbi:hypothetical protein JDV02_006021 [Purpureocillium takamizusanense]|uniref:Uncharacterized protein n=1 Tax=Purpureocillium takamizusanense TaxID=2060973 RepID=A0A9Q8QJC2_9HYPO|nr:uncharacterized protein JDV02_006021 [Purpureocillium takamizusanense]UNI19876.1 hypothetical protein JDV02_006021 [Purpureocillium takamizusanense]